MENFKKFSNEMDVVVFGAGDLAMRFMNRIGDLTDRLKYIVTNNKYKIGGTLYGIPVVSPDVLKTMDEDHTLVVIAAGRSAAELYEQTLSMGNYTVMAARILLSPVASEVAKSIYTHQREIHKVYELLDLTSSKKSTWNDMEVEGMGTILGGTCPGCGYGVDLKVGGGLRDCMAETALAAARGMPQQAELTAALRQGSRFRIDRFPAACGKCRTLRTATRVVWFPPEGESRVVTTPCPDCGGRMEWYTQDAPVVRCPECGRPIQLESVGHWD